MKTLIAACLLLALASSAHAYGDHANYDCGDGVEATGWKGQIGVQIGKNAPSEHAIKAPRKGTFKWDDKGLWFNGRQCMFLNDRDYFTKNCAENDESSCGELANDYEMTPEQVEKAVNKWKTTWPGNTIKYPKH